MQQPVYDGKGRQIGAIYDNCGKVFVNDRTGRQVGHYDPKTDTTYDRVGRPVAKGNMIGMLLTG